MKTLYRAALALSLLTSAGVSAAATPRPFPAPAKAGLRGYTYQVAEFLAGKIQHAYRMTFDLQSGTDGSTDALIRSAEELADAKTWRAVTVDDTCKAALHAPTGGLARVRLWPVDPVAGKSLGPAFIDTCAPPAVFFPLTDILNVVIIPVSPNFKVEALKHQGDVAHYPGFDAAFDRSGISLRETAHGGEVALVSLDRDKAVVDWAPLPADLELKENANGQPMQLKGTEHFAFRVTLDARTGALIEAHTTYDDLDLVAHMANMPDAPGAPLKITRAVTIDPH